MKNLIVFFSVLFAFTQTSFSNDVLSLVDKETGEARMHFSGEVKKINDCEVVFKAEGKRYKVPATEIHSIIFEDENSELLDQYRNMGSSDACFKGSNDAQMYHNGTGAFACGILFGPFAVIGSALISPSPYSGKNSYMSQNREIFSDPSYLNCYSRSAKNKNIKNSALGWLTWVVLALVASGA